MSPRILLFVIMAAFALALISDCTTTRPCPTSPTPPCHLPPPPPEYHAHAVPVDGGSFISNADALGIADERDALRDWVRSAAPCVAPQPVPDAVQW